MTLRVLGTATALLGAVLWVANLFVARTVLEWLGATLVGVAVASGGASLVRVAWLRLVAAAGAVALGVSVWQLALTAVDDQALEGLLGGVAAFVVAVSVLRGPGVPQPRPGNHRS